MKRQCRKTPFGKVCVNVPQTFQRNCELTAYAEVCHPSANAIKGDITNCTKQAVGAGVLAGVYTGNLAAATTALKSYLIACLKVKGVQQLARLSVTVRTETKCGAWKPR